VNHSNRDSTSIQHGSSNRTSKRFNFASVSVANQAGKRSKLSLKPLYDATNNRLTMSVELFDGTVFLDAAANQCER